MKVKLNPGSKDSPRAVRDEEPPYTLMPEGEVWEVPDNQYWRRRIRDGDVTLEDEGEKPSGSAQEGASPRRPIRPPGEPTPPPGEPQRGP